MKVIKRRTIVRQRRGQRVAQGCGSMEKRDLTTRNPRVATVDRRSEISNSRQYLWGVLRNYRQPHKFSNKCKLRRRVERGGAMVIRSAQRTLKLSCGNYSLRGQVFALPLQNARNSRRAQVAFTCLFPRRPLLGATQTPAPGRQATGFSSNLPPRKGVFNLSSTASPTNFASLFRFNLVPSLGTRTRWY